MNIQAIDISKVNGAPTLWKEIVDASSDGWIWHTWLAHEFNLEAGIEYGARDASFFVYKGGRAVGVVPLIVEKRSGQLQAAYYSGYLPWPCFTAGSTEREELERFAFEELERRARAMGALRIIMYLTPSKDIGDEEERVKRCAREHCYTPASFDSHVATLDGEWRSRVRERYRRYVKKFLPLFSLSIVEGTAVTPVFEEQYFRLHIADAGKQVRSRRSYTRQADFARQGEGLYIVATHKEHGAIVGALLVSLYKGVAFDNSVGIDPSYAHLYVGHLLRMR
ncbi:MAG: hypothetical protein Q8P16_00685, partial [bacterium]|nr:hypothetical protein [bacterium]